MIKERRLENLNIDSHQVLTTPNEIKRQLPVPAAVSETVTHNRAQAFDILRASDKRLLVVVGPCSIHDPAAAFEYAGRLADLADRLKDRLFIVMRAYFEKPRTTVGWKGLINDPDLDDSFDVSRGLTVARRLLLDIAALGLPLSTEALDPITPQYIQDLITWSAIGARTAESQTHREMASGLSCAVGFKNGTDGSLDVAINALESVAKPHRFLGINPTGQVSVLTTLGNPHAHIVLRGGSNGSNYDAQSVSECEDALHNIGREPAIMIDCSHANSNKDPSRQPHVARSVMQLIEQGSRSIIGLMLESHLHAGSQSIRDVPLKYGVSVTDGCIGWEETVELLTDIANRLEHYR